MEAWAPSGDPVGLLQVNALALLPPFHDSRPLLLAGAYSLCRVTTLSTFRVHVHSGHAETKRNGRILRGVILEINDALLRSGQPTCGLSNNHLTDYRGSLVVRA